ncbi:hypothetical protein DFH27DRAFT_525027 [Peziza echinospora]|nr:hypothetical protein DFH27DRAFT_525027 [Peziza echinospora]
MVQISERISDLLATHHHGPGLRTDIWRKKADSLRVRCKTYGPLIIMVRVSERISDLWDTHHHGPGLRMHYRRKKADSLRVRCKTYGPLIIMVRVSERISACDSVARQTYGTLIIMVQVSECISDLWDTHHHGPGLRMHIWRKNADSLRVRCKSRSQNGYLTYGPLIIMVRVSERISACDSVARQTYGTLIIMVQVSECISDLWDTHHHGPGLRMHIWRKNADSLRVRCKSRSQNGYLTYGPLIIMVRVSERISACDSVARQTYGTLIIMVQVSECISDLWDTHHHGPGLRMHIWRKNADSLRVRCKSRSQNGYLTYGPLIIMVRVSERISACDSVARQTYGTLIIMVQVSECISDLWDTHHHGPGLRMHIWRKNADSLRVRCKSRSQNGYLTYGPLIIMVQVSERISACDSVARQTYWPLIIMVQVSERISACGSVARQTYGPLIIMVQVSERISDLWDTHHHGPGLRMHIWRKKADSLRVRCKTYGPLIIMVRVSERISACDSVARQTYGTLIIMVQVSECISDLWDTHHHGPGLRMHIWRKNADSLRVRCKSRSQNGYLTYGPLIIMVQVSERISDLWDTHHHGPGLRMHYRRKKADSLRVRCKTYGPLIIMVRVSERISACDSVARQTYGTLIIMVQVSECISDLWDTHHHGPGLRMHIWRKNADSLRVRCKSRSQNGYLTYGPLIIMVQVSERISACDSVARQTYWPLIIMVQVSERISDLWATHHHGPSLRTHIWRKNADSLRVRCKTYGPLIIIVQVSERISDLWATHHYGPGLRTHIWSQNGYLHVILSPDRLMGHSSSWSESQNAYLTYGPLIIMVRVSERISACDSVARQTYGTLIIMVQVSECISDLWDTHHHGPGLRMHIWRKNADSLRVRCKSRSQNGYLTYGPLIIMVRVSERISACDSVARQTYGTLIIMVQVSECISDLWDTHHHGPGLRMHIWRKNADSLRVRCKSRSQNGYLTYGPLIIMVRVSERISACDSVARQTYGTLIIMVQVSECISDLWDTHHHGPGLRMHIWRKNADSLRVRCKSRSQNGYLHVILSPDRLMGHSSSWSESQNAYLTYGPLIIMVRVSERISACDSVARQTYGTLIIMVQVSECISDLWDTHHHGPGLRMHIWRKNADSLRVRCKTYGPLIIIVQVSERISDLWATHHYGPGLRTHIWSQNGYLHVILSPDRLMGHSSSWSESQNAYLTYGPLIIMVRVSERISACDSVARQTYGTLIIMVQVSECISACDSVARQTYGTLIIMVQVSECISGGKTLTA